MPISFGSPACDPPKFSRPNWAEIDLDAIRFNCRALTWLAGKPAIAVIKANAYGHGAVEVAGALLRDTGQSSLPIDMLAVASVDEALQLRAAGIEGRILLLSAILPEEAPAAVRAGLVSTVFTMEVATALDQAAAKLERKAEAHLDIDTGMGRIGVWHEEAPALMRELAALEHLRISGVYTHLASADKPDGQTTVQQLAWFRDALRAMGIEPGDVEQGIGVHAANSAGLLCHEGSFFNVVRPGIGLYGVNPALHREFPLKPAMTWKAGINAVKTIAAGRAVSYGATWRAPRESCVATLAVGYADGYPRLLSNRGEVLIRGQRCKVVGNVTMDNIMVDCTQLDPQPQVGEIATLLGPGLPVEELAAWAQTISYEILCGVGQRVPRVYVTNSKPNTGEASNVSSAT